MDCTGPVLDMYNLPSIYTLLPVLALSIKIILPRVPIRDSDQLIGKPSSSKLIYKGVVGVVEDN